MPRLLPDTVLANGKIRTVVTLKNWKTSAFVALTRFNMKELQTRVCLFLDEGGESEVEEKPTFLFSFG